MSKLIVSLCLILLSACANKAVKDIAIPTKLEDFKKDRYNRLSCGGYAILDHALAIGGNTKYYKQNTTEFVCEHPNSSLPTCPPSNWKSNGCEKYAAAYRQLIFEAYSKNKP